MSIRKTLIADLQAVRINVSDETNIFLLLKHLIYCLIFFPNFACVFCYRINRYLEVRKLPFRKIMNVWRFYHFSNDISSLASIGPGLRLVHVTDIVIGSNVIAGSGLNVFNGVTIGAKSINEDLRMPVIGDNVFIGTGAKLIGPIKIGNNVIIGALAYCGKSLPDKSVAYGNPLNVITDQEVYSEPIWQFYWHK